MKTYIFQGQSEVLVNGLGIIKPGQEVSTEQTINNPLFVEKIIKTADIKEKLKVKQRGYKK